MRTAIIFLLFSVSASVSGQVNFSDKPETPSVSLADILMLEKADGDYEYTTVAAMQGVIRATLQTDYRGEISDSLSAFVPDTASAASFSDSATASEYAHQSRGDFNVANDMGVTGDAYLLGSLEVYKLVLVYDDMEIFGDLRIRDNLSVDGGLVVDEDMTVGNGMGVTGLLIAYDGINVGGGIDVLSGGIDVGGGSQIDGALTVTSAVSVLGGGIDVAGASSINGDLSLSSDLTAPNLVNTLYDYDVTINSETGEFAQVKTPHVFMVNDSCECTQAFSAGAWTTFSPTVVPFFEFEGKQNIDSIGGDTIQLVVSGHYDFIGGLSVSGTNNRTLTGRFYNVTQGRDVSGWEDITLTGSGQRLTLPINAYCTFCHGGDKIVYQIRTDDAVTVTFHRGNFKITAGHGYSSNTAIE